MIQCDDKRISIVKFCREIIMYLFKSYYFFSKWFLKSDSYKDN